MYQTTVQVPGFFEALNGLGSYLLYQTTVQALAFFEANNNLGHYLLHLTTVQTSGYIIRQRSCSLVLAQESLEFSLRE